MSTTSDTIDVFTDRVRLVADRVVPDAARGVVLFAHGSGSSRLSPRNREVARLLREAGLGTLLLDLLTDDEEAADSRSGEFRFDVPLLGQRLVGAIDQLTDDPATGGLPIGLFGASTGAAAALVAAAERPRVVRAVVSRGGRPDLAGDALRRVSAPVLLVVGGADTDVLRLNREAADHLVAPHRLRVVSGASHLFPEPGALAEAAAAARDWFERMPTDEGDPTA